MLPSPTRATVALNDFENGRLGPTIAENAELTEPTEEKCTCPACAPEGQEGCE